MAAHPVHLLKVCLSEIREEQRRLYMHESMFVQGGGVAKSLYFQAQCLPSCLGRDQ